jgi:lysophospholipase L1-like esterase
MIVNPFAWWAAAASLPGLCIGVCLAGAAYAQNTVANPSSALDLPISYAAASPVRLWGAESRHGGGPIDQDHWVTVWGCGLQLTEPANLPPVVLAHHTLRQFVHVTGSGNRLRVRFSNTYGTSAMTMDSVHVALAAGTGSAGSGAINPATDQALTFRGASAVSIPAGEMVLSDPADCALPSLTNLAISIYFADVSPRLLTGHPGSRTTSFIQPSNVVTAVKMIAASTTAHWYIITGVEVQGAARHALITLGDSITDGRGTITDGNNRWPDLLAERLSANAPTTGVTVVNMGIGGNAIYGGLGPAGVARFDRDVLAQNGARWLIFFEGVNDIGSAADETIASKLISAYTQWIDKAHAHHLLAYGATITPFGGNRYFTASHEASRQAVNTWLRTNQLCDGVADFDAVVRDPVTLTNLMAKYNSGDGLHLNPAGYQAMANAVDLSWFTH